MPERIAAWESRDGSVFKTREAAEAHDFESFAKPRIAAFVETHFDGSSERDRVRAILTEHAKDLFKCFPIDDKSQPSSLATSTEIRS